MPRLNIDFKTAYRFGTDAHWELFLNVANLLSFPHYVKPISKTVGFEEQSMFDREYTWWPIWLYGLMEARVDLGLKVTF